MSDSSVAAAIVRHIEELEVAMRHIRNAMDPRIEKETGRLIERKRKAFGWAGEVDDHLSPTCWLAPESWRMAGDTHDNFDLYFNFEGTDCIDEAEPETWIAQFLGFAGSGMRFLVDTNALGRTKWKALLRSDASIESLIDAGFACDPKAGTLSIPVRIENNALCSAFEDQDFTKALAPIELALDRIKIIQPTLDQLVAAVRAKA
jgi:hypothetical protein